MWTTIEEAVIHPWHWRLRGGSVAQPGALMQIIKTLESKTNVIMLDKYDVTLCHWSIYHIEMGPH